MFLSFKLPLVYVAIQITAFVCQTSGSKDLLLQSFPDEKTPQKSYLRETIGKIYNGFPVKEKYSGERYQYFVLSSRTNQPFCGGVLIASNIVLTAAHCQGVFQKISIGIYDKNAETSTFEEFNVVGEEKHPRFDEATYENDFMVVILDGNSNATPICMASDDLLEDLQDLRILGYGLTRSGLPSDLLLETDVKYINNRRCERRYSDWEPNENDDYYGEWRPDITKDMMCAHSNNGNDACKGDSGGPLILSGDDDTGRGDILVGLVSWGIECGKYPGVYSRVKSRLRWIKRKVEKYGGILPHCE